jgi:GNAT superfamily N-acetyltransferase
VGPGILALEVVRMVEVRPAVENEGWAIGALRIRAWQSAYRGLLSDAVLDGLQLWEEMWQELARGERPEERLWVAFGGGKVVGFCHAGPSRDEDVPVPAGEIHALYVEPDLVGFGVGHPLFERAVADLRERGFETLVLWVLEGAERARRFFEVAGWAADGARREVEGLEGACLVRYRLEPPAAAVES